MTLYKPSLPFIIKFLQQIIPEYEGMLTFIEKGGGWIRLPDEMNQAIERLKTENYPELYRDEQTLSKMVALAVMPAERINALGEEFKGLPEDQKPSFLEKMIEEMARGADAFVESAPVTDEAKQEVQKLYNEMTTEEQAAAIKQAQISLLGFAAAFFGTVSMMVHGRKLTDLVTAAENGDDRAFCLAVQIDKRILFALPYFRDRQNRALIEGDTKFLDRLHYRKTSPLLRGKIRYKTLWLAFALLDTTGYLDGSLKRREILDILEDAGVAGYGNRIEDESALGKRLQEYRRFQEINQKSRH